MRLRRQFAVFLVASLLLLSTITCEKQKPQLPQKMQAPTLAVSVPDEIPEIDVPPEPPAQQQEATSEEPPPKKAPAKHRSAKKPTPPAPGNQANTPATVNRPPATQPPPANQASSQANPTVAANRPPANSAVEGSPDTAIAAEVSSQTLNRQKQSTAELLDSTERDLKGLNRSLNHDEEAMLTQIKSYIAQSRKATSDGDFERAYNLAVKAHLLADALLKK
jgi:hypothetical protein